MKILPLRTMRLGGERVERGVEADVSDKDGAYALRHKWAVVANVEKEPSKMNVKELKAALDSLDVEYTSDDNKADLVALLESAQEDAAE